jgi:hypothetical protein
MSVRWGDLVSNGEKTGRLQRPEPRGGQRKAPLRRDAGPDDVHIGRGTIMEVPSSYPTLAERDGSRRQPSRDDRHCGSAPIGPL